jgi:hypothetical protein
MQLAIAFFSSYNWLGWLSNLFINANVKVIPVGYNFNNGSML